MNAASPVQGHCEPRFAEVRREFERNFAERGEIGAAVSIYHEGKLVVDLWGGVADKDAGRPWLKDTMAVVFSSTKGVAAVCLHILADRGRLDFDAPVARYWPEFAANGKEAITVAMVLSHQAGLPYWQGALPKGGLLDWELATRRLAEEPPVWEPGTRHGYHAVSLGFIEGEIVRRITDKTIGQFLRDEVAGPLGADVWIGLPESEEPRVSTVYLGEADPNSTFFAKLMAEPDWDGWKMVNNSGEDISPESVNSRARHAAEIPAAGGIMSARGLARVYSALSLDGSIDNIRVVSSDALPGMRTTRSASSCDLLLRLPTTFTLGFSKSWGRRTDGEGSYVIIGEQAFGTPGFGGNMGFADGQARLAFGYVMNRHGPGTGLNTRGQSLIDAAYRAAGFRTSAPGFWVA